jgi:hypothetical protein
MSEVATHQTGARKKRDTQPKEGTQVPIVKSKQQIVKIVSERNNYYELKMTVSVQDDPREINLNLNSFTLVPQNKLELIKMDRLTKQINLDSAQVRSLYPVISFDKILSIFYYEQQKMWKHSIEKEMYEKQAFAVFYTKDEKGTLLIARFLIGVQSLILSIHHPDNVPFLFDGGFIGSKIQRDTFQTKKLLLEAEPKESIIENLFLFIREIVFSKN